MGGRKGPTSSSHHFKIQNYSFLFLEKTFRLTSNALKLYIATFSTKTSCWYIICKWKRQFLPSDTQCFYSYSSVAIFPSEIYFRNVAAHSRDKNLQTFISKKLLENEIGTKLTKFYKNAIQLCENQSKWFLNVKGILFLSSLLLGYNFLGI